MVIPMIGPRGNTGTNNPSKKRFSDHQSVTSERRNIRSKPSVIRLNSNHVLKTERNRAPFVLLVESGEASLDVIQIISGTRTVGNKIFISVAST